MRSRASVANVAVLPEATGHWSRELALVGPSTDIVRLQPAPHLVLKRTWEIASIVLVIAACVFWAMFLRPQALGGKAGYVLVSGESMLPRYHTGDLVLVERQSSYHVGEVIAYHVPKGDPMAGAQVIHRIIGGDAAHGFVVQGDNRTAPDTWRPRTEDIVGAKAVRLPQAVLVLQFLRSPFLLGLLAASFAFVYLIVGREREDEPDAVTPLS